VDCMAPGDHKETIRVVNRFVSKSFGPQYRADTVITKDSRSPRMETGKLGTIATRWKLGDSRRGSGVAGFVNLDGSSITIQNTRRFRVAALRYVNLYENHFGKQIEINIRPDYFEVREFA